MDNSFFFLKRKTKPSEEKEKKAAGTNDEVFIRELR